MLKHIFFIFAMLFYSHGQAALLADYNFNNDLSGGPNQAPDASVLSQQPLFATESPFGFDSQVLLFSETEGVRIDLSQWSLDRTFSLVMYLRVEDVSGYRKLLDFNERAGDSGLYLNDGRLAMVQPGAVGPVTWAANSYVQLVFTRDDANQVKVYQDGVLILDFLEFQLTTDLSNTPALFLVVDDLSTNTENPAGALARLMVFDETLTQQQIDELGIVDVIFSDDFDVP